MGKETVSLASVSNLSKIRHSIDKCSRLSELYHLHLAILIETFFIVHINAEMWFKITQKNKIRIHMEIKMFHSFNLTIKQNKKKLSDFPNNDRITQMEFHLSN